MAKASGAKALDKVVMENVNSPGGHVVRVDADKYNAMKRAILAVLPKASAGMTVADLKKGLLPLLPDALFPGGAKAGWWLKGVQLDLEAKRLIARIDSKPMRLRRL
jgi:hypothetical protein